MIEMIFITSLAIMGLHAVTRDGQLLGFVERFWNRNQKTKVPTFKVDYQSGEISDRGNLDEWEAQKKSKLSNPLTECPTCMASIWGTIGYIGLMQPAMEWSSVGFWAVFVLAVAGINHIVTEVIYE